MSKKSERILLFSIFAICLGIRLAFITQKNLWFDEVFSWHISLDEFYTIISRTSADIHPPLYYFTLKMWSTIFGDSVFSIRLLSALFTSSAIFFIYPICKRFMNPVNAFIVLILYCVSPLNLYYSQEARMSAMNLFLNAGSVYFLLRLTDISRTNVLSFTDFLKNREFISYTLFTAAALYTHYFSFFILTAQTIYLFITFRRDIAKCKPVLFSFNLIAALYLLWMPALYQHLSKGQSWRKPQSLMLVLNEYSNYIKDLNLGLYYHFTNPTVVKLTAVFYGLVMLTAAIGLLRKQNSGITVKDNTPLLITLLAAVPLILAGIISFRQKVEFYRYLSIIVPYILMLLVYGLSKWNKNFITYPVIGCIVLINIFGVELHYSYKFKNDDYRDLISRINAEYKAGDRIYVEPHYYGWLIDYYKKQDGLQIPKTAYIRYGWNELVDSINVQRPERFWIVLDYSAVDTSLYPVYVKSLNSHFNKDFYMSYFTAPLRIDLYRFSQKK